MNLEMLQQKRSVFVAQKDQILANLNASIAAIAAIDELIGELSAEDSRRLATEAQLQQAAQEIVTERIALEPGAIVIDNDPKAACNAPVVNIDARGADVAAVDRLRKAMTKATNRKSSPPAN